MSVSDQIRQFVVKELMHEEPGASLTDDESLLERGILDSLGLLQVLAFMEQEFHFTVQDPDIIPENFESITSMTAFVERRRTGAAAH